VVGEAGSGWGWGEPADGSTGACGVSAGGSGFSAGVSGATGSVTVGDSTSPVAGGVAGDVVSLVSAGNTSTLTGGFSPDSAVGSARACEVHASAKPNNKPAAATGKPVFMRFDSIRNIFVLLMNTWRNFIDVDRPATSRTRGDPLSDIDPWRADVSDRPNPSPDEIERIPHLPHPP
jgi:hypothetical protein